MCRHYVLMFLFVCGVVRAGWRDYVPGMPSILPSEAKLEVAGEAIGRGISKGALGQIEGPIKAAGTAIGRVIDKSLPAVATLAKETLDRADKLLDKSFDLYRDAKRTMYTVAGVSAVLIVGFMVFRHWYNKEKKYTLPRVNAAKSWDDIIEPDYVRDTLLQKVQFIKLVRSARADSGYGLYRPLLLSGEHGTGKSAIAQLIARELDMRTVYVSSSHFMQYTPEKCFSELYHLLADATALNECMIVFDNVDDFLTLHDTAFVNKLLQLFVEVMSVNKTHCMIIGITRNSSELPVTLKNCFDDTIELTLPDYVTRKEMLLYYRDAYNEKYKHILKKPLSAHFTDEELDVLARSSEGVSGAQLESMVSEAVIQATMS